MRKQLKGINEAHKRTALLNPAGFTKGDGSHSIQGNQMTYLKDSILKSLSFLLILSGY
jgi:hypothetical protein